jgi:hypothetical protein
VVKHVIVASLASLALVVTLSAQSKGGSLQGTWQVTEVTTTGPNAATVKSPQPGMYLFTAKHYAILTNQGDKPRPEIANASQATATADELRAAWGPLTANAGTYEFSGDTLTLKTTIAKSQGNAKAGNWRTFSVKMNGKSLTLVSKANNTGPVANPTTTTFRKLD